MDAFLDATAHHAEGTRLPAFVGQQFRDFLKRGLANALGVKAGMLLNDRNYSRG